MEATLIQKIRISDLEFNVHVFDNDNIRTSPHAQGFTSMYPAQLEKFKANYGHEIILIDRNAKSPWKVFTVPAWEETIKSNNDLIAKTLKEWGTNE